MSIWYMMEGVVKVHGYSSEVQSIVEEFNDSSGEIEAIYDVEAGIVTFSGGDFTTYTNASDLDEIARRLNKFALEPTTIKCNTDNNDITDLYIGPEDKLGEHISANALSEIKTLLGLLTTQDRHLLELLMKHQETENNSINPGESNAY